MRWPARAALLLALAGCATQGPAPAPAPSPSPLPSPLPSSVPALVPDGAALVPEGGVLRHRASGMAFPAEVAGFVRDQPHVYDAAGLDVSLGYDLPGPNGGMIATVYAFPAPTNATSADGARILFARYKDEIAAVRGGARPVAEARAEAPPGAPGAEGWHASYAYTQDFRGARTALRSHLFVFCCIAPGWALEYRFSYPERGGLDAAMQRFLRALPVTIPARG